MSEFRGLAYLSLLTFQRQLAARKTFIAVALIGLASLGTTAWSRRSFARVAGDEELLQQALNKFADEVFMPIFVSFLLPLLALIYATAAIGEEREERTLVYLLIRPLSRYRIYLAKAFGVLPLVILVGVGGFAVISLCAGPAAGLIWNLFEPAVLRGCIAYTCLFLLFGAIFPKPLVLAVVYAFFCEALLGNMPGTIKRLAVSFHTRCLMYDAGANFGIKPDSELQFVPISGDAARWVLDLTSIGLLAFGAFLFHRKEFRDFTS